MNTVIVGFASVFAKEKYLSGTVAATLILYGINLAAKLMCGLYSLFIVDLIFFLCIVFLYIAHQRQNKNVQRGLLGAVLMWYLYDEVNYVIANIVVKPHTNKFACFLLPPCGGCPLGASDCLSSVWP